MNKLITNLDKNNACQSYGVTDNSLFPERPLPSPIQALCSGASDKLLHSGKILCWSSHSYSPAVNGGGRKKHKSHSDKDAKQKHLFEHENSVHSVHLFLLCS